MKLKRRLMQELKPAKVTFEKVPGLRRYRVTIVSGRFTRKPHLKRQDVVWEIIDRHLPREALGKISLVFPYSPEERQTSTAKRRRVA